MVSIAECKATLIFFLLSQVGFILCCLCSCSYLKESHECPHNPFSLALKNYTFTLNLMVLLYVSGCCSDVSNCSVYRNASKTSSSSCLVLRVKIGRIKLGPSCTGTEGVLPCEGCYSNSILMFRNYLDTLVESSRPRPKRRWSSTENCYEDSVSPSTSQ